MLFCSQYVSVYACQFLIQKFWRSNLVHFWNTVLYRDNSRRHACSVVCTVWNTGTRSESLLPLEDEDEMTEITVDGWKRINTLSHYNVKDNSEIQLLHQKDHYSSVSDEEPHVVRNVDGKMHVYTVAHKHDILYLTITMANFN